MTTTPTAPSTDAVPSAPRAGRGRAAAIVAAGLVTGAVLTGAVFLGLHSGTASAPAGTTPVVVHDPIARNEPIPSPRSILAPPAAPAPSAAVATLQRELGQLDYYEGPITGTMNTQTVDAITYLQRDAHLPQTGRMDAATQQALVTMLAHGMNQMAS